MVQIVEYNGINYSAGAFICAFLNGRFDEDPPKHVVDTALEKLRYQIDELYKSVKIGDKVKWSYRHHLNRKSYTINTRYGVLVGYVKHRSDYSGPQMAKVKFVGNKTYSVIPAKDLTKDF